MKYEITSPDGRRFEVTAPDGASQGEVLAYAKSQWDRRKSEPKKLDPTDGMSGTDKFLAGMGKGMTDLGQGIGQRLGMVSEDQVAESRRLDAPLMNTGAGTAGKLTGDLTVLLPALAVPGANTVAGAALLGGASGLAQPTAQGESALQNAALGAAIGGGAQYGIGKLATAAGSRLASKQAAGDLAKAQNAPRDATLKEVQGAGYVVPPSESGAGLGSRILEGVSGKYKTNQAMGVKNQNVTDTLARRGVGLADDVPITREAMQDVRNAAYQKGYEPVTNAGTVPTSKAYEASLDTIKSNYQGAANSFPGAVKNEVSEFVDSLKVPQFDAGDAIKMTRVLRDQADAAYAQGNKAMGKASKEAASAIEDEIERHLSSLGKDGVAVLKEFRAARTLMAKTYNVERALQEGGGRVNAKVLGAALQKGKPLTDELRTIGLFANNFGDVAGMPKSGWASPITALDAFGAAGMAGVGAGPMSVALPAARMGARSLISNPKYQSAFVHPSYGPNAAQRLTPKMLKELEEQGVGGLLGSIYSAQ